MLSSKFIETMPGKQLVSQIQQTISESRISISRNIELRNFLSKGLNLDSFDLTELSVNIEDKLKIYLSEDLSKVKSIKYLTKIV